MRGEATTPNPADLIVSDCTRFFMPAYRTVSARACASNRATSPSRPPARACATRIPSESAARAAAAISRSSERFLISASSAPGAVRLPS